MTALLHLLVLSARKNVLFLAADDLRVQLGVDRVPGTHSMSTPNMDALISKSLFLRKVGTAASTHPPAAPCCTASTHPLAAPCCRAQASIAPSER